MWARARFDIRDADLGYGMRRCVNSRSAEDLSREIEGLWSKENDTLVCYSVRTGFDLVLRALDFPPGTEILFSALNIKGMVKVAKRLRLVPVPIDLDLTTGSPDPESMERAISSRTRAVIVAPLFGARFDMTPIRDLARRHDLKLIEDCAQAFTGLGSTGDESAVVSMFSFGPLKFATALGGALLRVRDPALLLRMRAIEAEYPVQTTREYFGRLLRFRALRLLTTRPALGAIEWGYRMRGKDYEDAITDRVRAVAKLGSAKRIRKRCSAAMLSVLLRRLTRFDPASLVPRRQAGRRLLGLLQGSLMCPGSSNADHNFWTFPILVEDPVAAMAALRQAGFDAASLRRSEAVAPPEDRPELAATVTRDALAHLIVVPCYAGMSDATLVKEAEILRTLVSWAPARAALHH